MIRGRKFVPINGGTLNLSSDGGYDKFHVVTEDVQVNGNNNVKHGSVLLSPRDKTISGANNRGQNILGRPGSVGIGNRRIRKDLIIIIADYNNVELFNGNSGQNTHDKEEGYYNSDQQGNNGYGSFRCVFSGFTKMGIRNAGLCTVTDVSNIGPSGNLSLEGMTLLGSVIFTNIGKNMLFGRYTDNNDDANTNTRISNRIHIQNNRNKTQFQELYHNDNGNNERLQATRGLSLLKINYVYGDSSSARINDIPGYYKNIFFFKDMLCLNCNLSGIGKGRIVFDNIDFINFDSYTYGGGIYFLSNKIGEVFSAVKTNSDRRDNI